MALPTTHGELSLVADPEIRHGQSGTPVCKFRGAASRRAQDENGNWYDKVKLFIDVKVFGKIAEHVYGSVKKGDLVTVSGQLITEEWTNQEGQNRSRLVWIADSVGASLKYRTFEHHARQQGQEAPAQQQQDVPPQYQQKQQAAQQQPLPPAQQPPQRDFSEEPPFR